MLIYQNHQQFRCCNKHCAAWRHFCCQALLIPHFFVFCEITGLSWKFSIIPGDQDCLALKISNHRLTSASPGLITLAPLLLIFLEEALCVFQLKHLTSPFFFSHCSSMRRICNASGAALQGTHDWPFTSKPHVLIYFDFQSAMPGQTAPKYFYISLAARGGWLELRCSDQVRGRD